MSTWRKVVCCLAMVAGLSFGASAYVALDYEQDGLVCQFDGIENVGHGQAHSSDTDRWVDLTGNGYDWTLDNQHCSWTDLGLSINGLAGSMGSKSGEDFQNNVTTVEFVFANEAPKADTILMAPGYAHNWYLYTDKSGRVGFWGPQGGTRYGYAAAAYSTNNYSVVYNRTGATPSGVKDFAVRGLVRATDGMGDWWDTDTGLFLGNRTKGDLPAKGRLLALRIYSRELSPDERRANARIDRERFNLPVDRVPVVVTACGDGLVSLDGGAFASVVSNDCVCGDEVSIAAQDGSSAEFLLWQGDSAALPAFDRASRSVALVAGTRKIELAALFNDRTSGGDKRIAQYSYDGLLDMWDGISNVSLTNAHDDTATVWNDLVSTRHMTIDMANANVISNALECLGKGNCAKAASAQTGYYTIEIVMDPPSSSKEQIPFTGGSPSRIVATSPTAAYMLEGAAAGPLYYTGHDPNTFAFTYSSSGVSAFYEGGSQKTLSSGNSGWSKVTTVVNIGSRDNAYNYTGRIYAIRLYNRVLDDAELAAHAVTDGIRFFGKSETKPGVIDVRGPGAVRLNGDEPKTAQEIDLPYGSELNLVAVPAPGADFVAWVADGADLTGTNIISTSLTLPYTPALRRVTAVFLPADDRIDRRVTDYSFDGLIGLWDGICNTGFGCPHDSTTNVWKDLAGTRPLPLVSGCGEFSENALRCLPRSSGMAAGPAANSLAGIRSYEIVCEPSGYCCALNFGSGPFVVFNNGKVEHHTPGFLYLLTTNLSTLAFVNDPTSGWTVYENGAVRTDRDSADKWNVGTSFTVGGSSAYPTKYLYQGRIFAIRAYSRALSPIEVVRHSDLDQLRFFDCAHVDADRGVRTNAAGAVECLLRVTADGPGTVSVNGHPVGSGDLWYPEGTEVSLQATAEFDCAFLGWIDDDRRALSSPAAYMAPSIAVTVFGKTVVGAAFVKNRVLLRASASSYARNGLTGYWDGRENVGFGLAHDSATNRWVDLSGNGRDWALDVETNGRWSDTGLVLAGLGRVGVLADGAPAFGDSDVRTVEFVYANAEKRDGTVFSPGKASVFVYTDKNGGVGFRAVANTETRYGYAAALGETNAYSVVNEPLAFDWFAVNGIPRKNDGMIEFWSKGANSTAIGATSDNIYGKGELMAMRFYNRRLTGPERLLNAKLDALRYLGEKLHRPTGLCVIIR